MVRGLAAFRQHLALTIPYPYGYPIRLTHNQAKKNLKTTLEVHYFPSKKNSVIRQEVAVFKTVLVCPL